MGKRIATVVILLVIHCLRDCVTVHLSNLTDESALLALKARITFDPNNILANNWSEAASFCNWVGVSCSPRHHRVTALNLPNMGLGGTIPEEIGNLSFLTSFNVSKNNFHGNLPTGLGHLRRLKLLDLGSNELSGSIPSSLGLLSKLEVMRLAFNKISGFIPSTIFNISSLQRIQLSNNSLQGTLPMDMCDNLPKLALLYLASNLLGGQLPTSLSKCTQLQYIWLSQNKFTGNIPKGIDNLSKLQWLYLGSNSLTGELPSTIFNISSLEGIDLSNNTLYGTLPMEMCNKLPKLEMLDLGVNQLGGQLPTNLSNCQALKVLYLGYNKFMGTLNGIDKLSALQTLWMRRNRLTGKIPPSIGNMSTLEYIDIRENNIEGNIPKELNQLVNLQWIDMGINNLVGEIPESIFNISTLQVIVMQINRLSGNLPSTMGLGLPNLVGLYLGSNKLSGTIPSSSSNATKLVDLMLSSNPFHGPIPTSFGNLGLLRRLYLDSSQLTNDPSALELAFLASLTNCRHLEKLTIALNPLNGILPKSLGNLSTSLQVFDARNCGIRGMIPSQIGNLSSLIQLYLGNNDLTGTIPRTLGQLRMIQGLQISYTLIQGFIPVNLCNLTNLYGLELSNNKLSGSIPGCFGHLTSLRLLYLSNNELSHQIPTALWSLDNINILDLSSNALTDSLSPEIGNLKHATQLYLSKNQLTGQIPSTFGQLQSMQYMDLSYNNLSGVIPKSMEKLSDLKYFNVSFNRLSGEIPDGGPFTNFTAQSFLQNDALCGLHVRPCSAHKQSRSTKFPLKYILPPVVSVVVAAALLTCRLMRKSRHLPVQLDPPPAVTHKRLSYQEIRTATNYFSEENLVGRGSLGLVYRATFSDGMVAAVKVFDLEIQSAFNSFDAECEIMRTIHHRNLVKVISSCSNLDFKALVLQYMPSGNLDQWLHSHNNFLNLIQRLDLMIDVASAMEYLHHALPAPVVHCDLKPTNILLNEDMVAHVADFGIAKLMPQDMSARQTKTLGTIGYMAPEYGSAGIISTTVDVYSYGILLMETFTRKRPTDDQFNGEVSLKDWVFESFPDAIMEVVDDNLLRAEENSSALQDCISSLFGLALECTPHSPEERTNMIDALWRLKKIKAKFQKKDTQPSMKPLVCML